jgi:glutamate synthase domain-containing protein 3
MTGGRVVVIGRTGRSFAAGMSGGVAYVLDGAGDFKRRVNPGMVDVEPLARDEDAEEVRALLRRHVRYTESTVAAGLLADWAAARPRFVKVMPRDYKRALAAMERARAEGIPWERAVMEGAHG